MTQRINLNELEPETDYQTKGARNIRDNSRASGGTTVYFRNLVERLCEHISNAHLVMGCVAWLTHPKILEALQGPSTAIVVQKEDFLRPDLGASTNWKADLRRRYNSLHCNVARFEFSNLLSELDTCGDPIITPVRCVGNYNKEKSPAFPRMHNKFLIFARVEDCEHCSEVVPYAVWTGSFNLTYNAANSLENAVLLTDPEIVRAFYEEYGQIMALSEPLDWESEWSAPEWRIGS